MSVNTDSRTCAGLWVWPTRGPGRFSLLWVAGICPWNLRSLRFRPGPRFAKHVICTCPQLPLGKLRTPGKEVVLAALCRLRGAEHLAQGHTHSSGERPAWSVLPWPCSGARLCQVLNDRPAELGRAPRAPRAACHRPRRQPGPAPHASAAGPSDTPPPPRIQQPGRADSPAGKEGLSTVHVWGRRASLRGDRHSRTHAPIAHAHR